MTSFEVRVVGPQGALVEPVEAEKYEHNDDGSLSFVANGVQVGVFAAGYWLGVTVVQDMITDREKPKPMIEKTYDSDADTE